MNVVVIAITPPRVKLNRRGLETVRRVSVLQFFRKELLIEIENRIA